MVVQGDSTIDFVNAWFCPFAQRTWLTLNEKNAAYKDREISPEELYGKADWFLDLNPTGLIPVLAYKEGSARRVVTESLVCNEFLEDYVDGPKLMPESPYDRAQARIIIARFDSTFVRQFFRYLIQQGAEAQETAKKAIDGELRYLNSLLKEGGPYILGKDFSLVDTAIIPFLIRVNILEEYRNYQIPSDCAQLVEYLNKVTKRPSVLKTMTHPEGQDYYKALLKFNDKYADGTAKSQMADRARE